MFFLCTLLGMNVIFRFLGNLFVIVSDTAVSVFDQKISTTCLYVHVPC